MKSLTTLALCIAMICTAIAQKDSGLSLAPGETLTIQVPFTFATPAKNTPGEVPYTLGNFTPGRAWMGDPGTGIMAPLEVITLGTSDTIPDSWQWQEVHAVAVNQVPGGFVPAEFPVHILGGASITTTPGVLYPSTGNFIPMSTPEWSISFEEPIDKVKRVKALLFALAAQAVANGDEVTEAVAVFALVRLVDPTVNQETYLNSTLPGTLLVLIGEEEKDVQKAATTLFTTLYPDR